MSGPIWRFSGVEFDERRRELRIRGLSVDVEVKPLDVLLQLLRNAGEVVTKEELLEAVWPNTEVVDASLATAVSKLRKALGSYGDLVVTVPRVGYRLAATVEQSAPVDMSWPVLKLEAGDFAPARSEWRLTRQLHSSPRIEVWLAEHIETHQKRVFKYAHDEVGLISLNAK